MKSITENFNFQINTNNNKRINKTNPNSSDYKTLLTINENNMNSIDKKIKTKYSSALEYINNNFSNKKPIKQNNFSYNDKLIKLRNDVFSSIYNNVHFSNFKTYSQNNNYRKNTINYSTNNDIKDTFRNKINNILLNPQKLDANKPKINKSMISKLRNNKALNKKTKDKIDEILNIFEPEHKNKNNDEKEEIEVPESRLKQLRNNRIKTDENFLKGQKISFNKPIQIKCVSKINPHIDLYDKTNSVKNTKKSDIIQRIVHLTKRIDSDLNDDELENENFDNKHIYKNNDYKDLFELNHEGKIRNKLIDISRVEIFPDVTRRQNKDHLLLAYAENNLKIISDIKSDLINPGKREENKENEIISSKVNKRESKFLDKKQEPKIDVKEEINIDDLLH
jgi:hypothetical protein